MRGTRLLLVLVLLAVAGLRWRLLEVPLERDEGGYAYVAQRLLAGVPPYADAYTLRLPGVDLAYAAILAAFGPSTAGIRQGLIVVNAATTLLVHGLGTRLAGTLGALVAAAAFALLSLGQSVLGFSANAEQFVVLPAVGGWLILLGAAARRRIWPVFASGLLFGVAFLMKQQGLAFVLGAALVLLLEERRVSRRLVARETVLALGALLPFALLSAWLVAAGVQDRFWLWSVVYARHYATALDLATGLDRLRAETAAVVGSAPALWALAGLGLLAPLWDGEMRRWALPVTLFAACSFLAVSPGLVFREHYFVLLLPAAALLAGIGVEALRRISARRLPGGAATLAASAVATLALLAAVVHERRYLFTATPVEVARASYEANPFPESIEIGRYIRTHSAPGEEVAVIGSEPQIYFYAGRRAATGYIYMYPMMQPLPFARAMQEEMIRQIEAARPRFLVVVDVAYSWVGRPDSDWTLFTWLGRWVPAHYHRVGIADIGATGGTAYRWGADARTYVPQSDARVLLYERLPTP